MAFTYTMKLDSNENKPLVLATFPEIPQNRLTHAMEMATKAFRSVTVTCDDTGEIILEFYMDSEWFLPTFNYGEMVDMLCHICYDE